ncbi:deoxycytidylate deaminase [Labrys okinawensis]|uniref:Deoxycytidylate deaminase n=1 Tax=Labrys okinawensis TaxID=346911 RepID=A0A2S9QH86_9HYPH|nr:anti-phage dCTP deaminase [Labrys okinawensis]PRH88708.1 deoxycytidylate deaminase [Labrys okinawensis]
MVKNLESPPLGTSSFSIPKKVPNPELIIGLVGPIGADIDSTVEFLTKNLKEVNYSVHLIHLTDYMEFADVKQKIDKSTYYNKYKTLISYANEFRKMAKNNAAMAGLAIMQIRAHREKQRGDANSPALGTAYIIRQFKRPEEIDVMRGLYGRKFIQVSIYGNEIERRRHLIQKIRRYDNSPKSDSVCEKEAIELIDIDYNEKDKDNGQRISDVFHLGDLFVDSLTEDRGNGTIYRFIQALFGHNGCSPNKDEYGLYIAAAASLRSIDLSRQVGAAIFSGSGDVISMGCNEVPKAGGGTYWCDDPGKKHRDFEQNLDPNNQRKNEIIYDFVARLSEENLLEKSIQDLPSVAERFQNIISRSLIKDSQVMDIIEYGRIIHAEMNAITDAARLGRSTSEATLFCTTFPCHICAKHIVSSGVKRVVFLEPYPKSYAESLHNDSITFDPTRKNKVLFQPFIGISPRRYRDIFEKKKRKDSNGRAEQWYEKLPAPMIEDRSAAYIENEQPFIFVCLQNLIAGQSTQ